jgi:hypothetical protein
LREAMGTARVLLAYMSDSFAVLSDFGDESGADMVGQRLARARQGTTTLCLS